MRVFKSELFAEFASKEMIPDYRLCKAAKDIEDGLIDANYGGGVIKQRIPRNNSGKSGGYRAIALFRKRERIFFVYGFAKNNRDNIDRSDERDFKVLAKSLLFAPNEILDCLVRNGKYIEVKCDA